MRALEEAHYSGIGRGPKLSPFDLDAPLKLSLSIEELFLDDAKAVDFVDIRRQKEIDVEELAQTKVVDFSDQVETTVLFISNSYGEMYLTLTSEVAN
ncbi:unnamed protein product [Prunus armeniaca]